MEAPSATVRSGEHNDEVRGTRSSRQKGKKGDGSSASSSSSTSSMPSASSMSSMPLMTRDQLREAAAKEVAEQRQAEKAKQEADEGRKGGSKRKLMSSEEKAKANRDRNREHARNTRLRKKAYVAKLTQLVSDLSTQTEAQARERALQVTREREQTTVRRNVLRIGGYRSTGRRTGTSGRRSSTRTSSLSP